MLEFLLKYSPVVFSNGQIGFRFLPSLIAIVGILSLFTVILLLAYRKTTLEMSHFFKTSLIVLKFIVLGLLLVMLFEPVIHVSTVIPQKSSIILLLDDSKSMSIRDGSNKQSRLQTVQKLLLDKDISLLEKLKKNFKVYLYKFSSETKKITTPQQVSGLGKSTDLAGSLKFAASLAEHGTVSAVVLISDGGNNSNQDPLQVATYFSSRKLPIYTIGVGKKNMRDLQLTKVSANQSVVENSVVEISTLINNSGYNDESVELELREDDTIIKKQKVTLKGSATRAFLKFSPQKKGFVRYSLGIVPFKDEVVTENNSKSFLIDNRNKTARVLYIEGYPRPEFKFIRRAMDGDENIELVSLLRTGPDKFYRQGIRSPDELKQGYPKTQKELFQYDAIIFGSIEASFFTPQQLQNTLEFVARRGGGFLMLGGGLSFAQGKYQGTPIEKMLPVELPATNGQSFEAPGTFRDRFKLQLTPEGLRHPIMQLSTDEASNREIWESLPDLEGYNPLGPAKPGATVLAIHPLSDVNNPKIILAVQKYGAGRTMVFASSTSWNWQMQMPHEDLSHEKFWRQTLRWLALSAPEPIQLHVDKDTYQPGEQVTIKVDLRDSTFNAIEDGKIKGQITTPSGEIIEVPFDWSSNGKVEYMSAFHPVEEGLYFVDISAYSARDEFLGTSRTAFFVKESNLEYNNAYLQEPLLKRIAEISGGKYFHEFEANYLADEISVRETTYSKMVEYDLWDMPLWFVLIVLLLSIEWFVRRNKGLS
ncbi:MAG: VWA domain-containing protein [Calditrichaeota bacterium]|nr:MAG: VWA domain-containing protein [Calditrichota bacterium]